MFLRIHSDFAKQFDAVSERFHRRPVIRGSCRALLRILLVPAWLGLFLAPAGIFSIPFQVLASFRVDPPAVGYWTVAALTSAGILLCLFGMGRRIRLELRQRVLDVESAVGFAGFLFPAAFTAYMLPRGWGHH